MIAVGAESQRAASLGRTFRATMFLALLAAVLAQLACILVHVLVWGGFRRPVTLAVGLGVAVSATLLLRRSIERLQCWAGRGSALQLVVVLAVAAGILLRLVAAYVGQADQRSDFAAYIVLGQALARGRPYLEVVGPQTEGTANGTERPLVLKAWRPPGYPLVLAAFYRLLGSCRAVTWTVDALLGMGVAVGAAAIARAISGRAAGVCTLAVMAALPLNVSTVWKSCSETAFGAFLFAGIAALSPLLAPKPRHSLMRSLLAGTVLGYAALIRPTGLVLICVAAAWLVCQRGGPRRGPTTVALLLGAAVAVLPWSVRNYVVLGRLVLVSTNGGEVFHSANCMRGVPLKGGAYQPEAYWRLRELVPDEVARDDIGYRLGWAHIVDDPICFLRSLPHRLQCFASLQTWQLNWVNGPAQLYPLALAGNLAAYWTIPLGFLIGLFRLRALLLRSSLACLVAFCYLALFGVAPLFEAVDRHHYPALLIPLLLTICSHFGPLVERSESDSSAEGNPYAG